MINTTHGLGNLPHKGRMIKLTVLLKDADCDVNMAIRVMRESADIENRR